MKDFEFRVAQKMAQLRAAKNVDSTTSIVGFNKINDHLFKVALASPHDIDLAKASRHIFEACCYSMIPVTGSFTNLGSKNGLNVATLVASRSPKLRRDLRTNGMIEIRANVFLDQEIGKQWNRQQDASGNEFFVATNDVDLEALLASQVAGASLTASLGKLDLNYTIGASVRFCLVDRGTPRVDVGKIKGLSTTEAQIVGSNGAMHRLPIGSIIAVIENDSSIAEDIYDMYNKSFPNMPDGTPYGDMAKKVLN